ncbi:RNA polymerase sigma factor [Archangium lipolyticum]|uniref:RNA polymerase sigma factor n=1 Tax=Archangium lipolyticum TaxID=2970465 RepID=UPI002149F281|nr:RNA polymerase sigma factor [Archangium lipolyticum]
MLLPGGSDREVLRAFREGDRATLTRVYRAYSPEVVRYLARRFPVRSSAGVDSIALGVLDLEAAHQETFVRAFRPAMRQAYDGVRPYLGFLLTIARSTALDLLRASGRVAREAVPLEDVPELNKVPAGDSGPEERALESEVRTLVREFLEGLSKEMRELARLRFMEGLSQEVAAERLHLTRGEVRVRERHLRTRFTEYLRARGWLEEAAPVSPRATEGLLVAFIALCGMGNGI